MAKAWIVKRNGRYIVKWSADGRQRWKTIGRKKTEAERALRDVLDEIDGGIDTSVRALRFDELCTLWMRDYAAVRVKPSTLASYRSRIRQLERWFPQRRLTDIRPQSIDQYIAARLRDKRVARNTVANEIALLRHLFRSAIAWNYLRRNPCASVERLHVQPRVMDFLRADEVQPFLRSVDPAFYTFFLTAVLTGMRRGELLALTWTDIDWQRQIIRVQRSLDHAHFVLPKTPSSMRDVLMTPRLRSALHALRNTKHPDTDLIFRTPTGQPLDPRYVVRKQFEPALQRAGLRRIRFHDLRHTYVTLAIQQGAHPKFIQHQLGHASIQTTLDRYGHLLLKDHEHIGVRLDTLLADAAPVVLASLAATA